MAEATNITELNYFLNLTHFFQRFIEDFLRISTPLTNASPKFSNMSQWFDSCSIAFDSLKKSFGSSPIMVAPDWGKPFRFCTYACNMAVVSIPTQIEDNEKEHIISYFSKRPVPAEEKCSANDSELQGLIYFLKLSPLFWMQCIRGIDRQPGSEVLLS